MITANLLGGGEPQDVQVVVDAAPAGVAWTLTGTADGFTWTVPGGEGVGDGAQVVRVDNRTPGNVPIVYTFTADTTVETSAPVTVPMSRDGVLSTPDGQFTVMVELARPSLGLSWDVPASVFRVPGRRMPAVRYDVISSGQGQFVARVYEPDAFERVMEHGGPVLFRASGKAFDLPRVFMLQPLSFRSDPDDINGFREWTIPYVVVDDPVLDLVLGSASWDEIDAAMADFTWDQVDARFAGLSWDEMDRFDWSTV